MARSSITTKELGVKPSDSDVWFYEVIIWGHGSLAARVTPSGERLFYFIYMNSQKKREVLPLGSYDRTGANGTLTLTDARGRATQFATLHKSGIKDIKSHLEAEEAHRKAVQEAEMAKLAKEKADAEAELARLNSRRTVRSLFEQWMRMEIIQRKDGGAEVRRMFEKDVLPLIGDRFAEDVRKGDVMTVIDALLERGVTIMAKSIFSMIRQMFNFAVERDYLDSNPTASINKAKVFGTDNERDRILSDEEIVDLSIKFTDANLLVTSQAALWIALATCCRIGEILSAEWKHVDLNKREWMIPAENSKNARPHLIYLSDFAVEQFNKIQAINGTSQWCFPNRDKTSAVCPKSVTKQVTDRQKSDQSKMISRRSQYFDALQLSGGYWTPHDLRRTGASLMVKLGVMPDVADRCMNHLEQNKVKRTYLRYDYAKEMLEAWVILGDYVAQILAGVPDSK